MRDKPPAPREILAKNLRVLIQRAKLTPPKVAKEAHIDRKSVTNMLNAKHNPNLDHVEAVARVFGLTAWQLIRSNLEKDVAAAAQVDGLIHRFYDADAEQRRTIMQVAEMTATTYKTK